MISTEQLVAALEELAPHDRELLELSLRRRVPDEALATLFEIEEAEVARRRANAIEQLSQLLDLQRGEDLGNVLKALLEHGTWAEVGARPGADKVEEGAGSEPAATENPEPVLELLADRPKAPDPEPAPTRRRWVGPAALAAGVFLVLGGAIGALALSSGESSGRDADDPQQRTFQPNESSEGGKGKGEPFASGSAPASAADKLKPGENVTATVKGRPVLYSKPGAGKKRVLPARTQFGTPRVFGVARRKGAWLAVQAPELKNGQVGWIRASEARLDSTPGPCTPTSPPSASRCARTGAGCARSRSPSATRRTPRRRGATRSPTSCKVTDAGSPYGCCVLALTGHQVELPAGLAGRRPPGGARHPGRQRRSAGRQPRLHAREVPRTRAGCSNTCRSARRSSSRLRRPSLTSTGGCHVVRDVSLPPFQTLLDEHGADVYRFLVASVGPVDADDCFQEACIAALRAYPTLEHADNLRAWLLKIAQRKAIDPHRAGGPACLPGASLPEQPPSAAGRVDGNAAIWAPASAGCPRSSAMAVFLRSVADLSYAELARALDCSRSRRGATCTRGSSELRKEMAA